MANTIASGATKQMWIPGVQKNLDSLLTARAISTVTRANDRIIYNPYHSQVAGSDGAAATAYSVADFTTSADSLTVNRRAVAAEHVDNIEELQASFALTQERMNEHSAIISKKIDQFALNLPVGSGGIALDDGDFGGTDGNAKTSSNSAIDDIVNTMYEQLAVNNSALEKGTFMVVSPYEMTDIKSFMQNNGFSVADETIKKGLTYRGTTFSGVDIYVSNNLTNVAVLSIATQPTDGDTVTIAGVTFTYKTTLGSTAGNVLIGASADTANTNLSALINAPGTTTAQGVALSTADQLILSRLQAAAVTDTGANTCTVTCKGTFSVSETLTATADGWGAVQRYLVGGVYGSMFLALPGGGTTFEKKAVTLKHGRELETSQIYNATIWTKMAPQIGTVLVN